MATATHIFSHNDRRNSSESDEQTPPTQNQRFIIPNNSAAPPRPGQHLDDTDLLAWKRQYINFGLRNQNVMSNSADDLTQLTDDIPIQRFNQDYDDVDDEELHLDNGTYDYETSIAERLKKANEDLKQDQTPAELKQNQRVSFDTIVKAVDIDQDPQEIDPSPRPAISPVVEETSTDATSPQNENTPHQYTVPLNDTQPREGPTLTEHLRAVQFHGAPLTGQRWSSANFDATNGSSPREDLEDLSSTNPNSNHHNSDIHQTSDMTTQTSTSPQKSMVVSINGGFELQNEDDYIARGETRFPNDEKRHLVGGAKGPFEPKPPTEPKKSQDPSKPQRPYPSGTRPKSSDAGKRPNYSNNGTSKSLSNNINGSVSNNSQRARSAGVSQSVESYIIKRPVGGVDFVKLNQEAAREKREKEEAERRKQKKIEAQRKKQDEEAKESFEKWVRDKDAERKRISEEKRLEQEQHEAREAQCEKELDAVREKKYQEWVERKNREVLMFNEFRKLQADDDELASGGGSSSSIHKTTRRENHRAFQRWLRRKYEQSKEEQRQLRLESRRLRRRQRRSIKRFQLQQDLQLARAFGYS